MGTRNFGPRFGQFPGFGLFVFGDFCTCWCSVGSSPSQLLCLGAPRLASRQRGCWAAGPLAFYPKAPNTPYAPRKQVCPLVGISKHRGANSTLLADPQKPQPQLGQNVQAPC